MEKQYYTIRELVEVVGIPKRVIDKAVHSKKANKFAIKSGTQYHINLKKLEAYLHDD